MCEKPCLEVQAERMVSAGGVTGCGWAWPTTATTIPW